MSIYTSRIALLLLLIGACTDNTGPARPDPDKRVPVMVVHAPHAGTYDEDGDGLLDLRVTWSDSGGAIDIASVFVRSLNRLPGPAGEMGNLAESWRVEQLDESGLVLRETVDHLLPQGPNTLDVTVTDTAGNSSTVTVSFTLPYIELHKTLDPPMEGLHRFVGGTRCADSNEMYFAGGRNLVHVNSDSMTVARVAYVAPGMEMTHPLCSAGDPYVYVTKSGMVRFERATLNWDLIIGSYSTNGITASRKNPDHILVGEFGSATPGIISRSQHARIASVDVPISTEYPDRAFSIAALPATRRST